MWLRSWVYGFAALLLLASFEHSFPCQAQVSQSRNDLSPEIIQAIRTQQNLDNLIADATYNAGKLESKVLGDLGYDFAKGGGAIPQQIASAKHRWDEVVAAYQAGKGLEGVDWEAVSDAVKLTSMITEDVMKASDNPELVGGSYALSTLRQSTDVAVKSVELYATREQLNQLLAGRQSVQNEIDSLNARNVDAESAKWEKIFNGLYGDPAVQHKQFLDWLKKQQLSPDKILASAVKDASSVSQNAAREVGNGLKIVDPDQSAYDLANIPGINPDFIAALQRCKQADAQAAASGWGDQNYYNAMTCDKYADGSYIPAFGPSRGQGAMTRPAVRAKATPSGALTATLSTTTQNMQPSVMGQSPSQRLQAGRNSVHGVQLLEQKPGKAGIALRWNGANVVAWRVVDADKRHILRQGLCGGNHTDTQDIAPGSYFVVLDDHPEVQPIPVSVTVGQASLLTPAVGQVALRWNGANVVAWKVIEGSRRYVLRTGLCGANQIDTQDIAPGSYFVALDDHPQIQPIPITVTSGQTSILTLR